MTRFIATVFLALVGASATDARAQQLIRGLTGPECAQRGGRILTWTSNVAVQPWRGECFIASGPGSAPQAAPNLPAPAPAQRALGALQGALGVLGGIANMMQRAEEGERQWVRELEDGHRELAEQTADEQRRLATQEDERRRRERDAAHRAQQSAAVARSQAANPFAGSGRSGNSRPVEVEQSAPQGATCDAYYDRIDRGFRSNANTCAGRSEALESLTEMIPAESSADTGIIRRRSGSQFWNIIPPNDDRWIVATDRAAPNCESPLLVRTQQDAFMECVRVYLCGLRATACARELSRSNPRMPCETASAMCLQRHPVPGGG